MQDIIIGERIRIMMQYKVSCFLLHQRKVTSEGKSCKNSNGNVTNWLIDLYDYHYLNLLQSERI